MSVAVISGAVVGTLLLTIIIIIITMVMIMILCRRRKKSRRAYNIDDKNVQLSHSHLPQQHTDDTSGQSLHHVITVTSCDHTDSNVLSHHVITVTSCDHNDSNVLSHRVIILTVMYN